MRAMALGPLHAAPPSSSVAPVALLVPRLEFFPWISQSLSAQLRTLAFLSQASVSVLFQRVRALVRVRRLWLILEIFLPTSTSILYSRN